MKLEWNIIKCSKMSKFRCFLLSMVNGHQLVVKWIYTTYVVIFLSNKNMTKYQDLNPLTNFKHVNSYECEVRVVEHSGYVSDYMWRRSSLDAGGGPVQGILFLGHSPFNTLVHPAQWLGPISLGEWCRTQHDVLAQEKPLRYNLRLVWLLLSDISLKIQR